MTEFYRNEHPQQYDNVPYWIGNIGGGNSYPYWEYPSSNDDGFGLSFETDAPILRLSAQNGYVLMCGPYLLKGSLSCPVVPMIVYIDDYDETQNAHWDCVLMKFSDERELTVKKSNSKQIASYCFFDWNTPGKFKLKTKWQAGHYNHADINQVQFIIFGITTGWKTLPLTSWVDVAEIDIRADGGVYVSGILGSADGNTQFLE